MDDATEGTNGRARPAGGASARTKAGALVVVLIIFAAIVAVKALPGTDVGEASTGGSDGGKSITSVHNDAVADYEAALGSGKAVYVLFHSLS